MFFWNVLPGFSHDARLNFSSGFCVTGVALRGGVARNACKKKTAVRVSFALDALVFDFKGCLEGAKKYPAFFNEASNTCRALFRTVDAVAVHQCYGCGTRGGRGGKMPGF